MVPSHVLWSALLFAASLPAQAETIRSAPWRTEEVGVGVVWKRMHFQDLFGAKEHVNVLEIDPSAQPRPRLSIATAHGKQRTSALGRQSQGIAAINGGFFDTKNGNPVGVLKVGGKLLHDDEGPKWVALGLGKDGKTSFLQKPHVEQAKYEEALAAGPMLLLDGKRTPHTGWENMAKVRHPRSAIGATANGKVLCVVVDGRTEQSAGMTCDELATMLEALGCTAALNLDGGGSSTLWVRGESDDGVVNCPCDAKTFDHHGERAVANALLVEAADVVVGDDAEATLTPRERFVGHADGPCLWGGFQQADDPSGVSAVWQLDGMLPGKYRVSACWPKVPSSLSVSLGERALRLSPRGAPGAWIELGEVDLSKVQAVRIGLSPDAIGPFPVDGVRLIQVR